MKLVKRIGRDLAAMGFVLAAIGLPSAGLFVYTRMHVETALLRRSIRTAVQSKDDLTRRNAALRRAIAGLSGENPETQHASTLARNRIVRIKLSETLEGTSRGD